MSQNILNEREFELINIIGADLGPSQRDLSRQMDMSLGMINMLIRRLASKGYIRISQLNKRKVKYILTPKGFTEKMRKSIKYTLKTIHSISFIKERIREILTRLYAEGKKNFIVLGKSDFALMIEIILKEMASGDYKIVYVDNIPVGKTEGTLLICKEMDGDGDYPEGTIDLIYELAKDHHFVASELQRNSHTL